MKRPPLHVLTRRDLVVDVLHGTEVSDPYRWLESGDAEEVREWVAQQNRRTEQYLDCIEGRAAFRARLEELLDIGHLSLPVVRRTDSGHSSYFYLERTARKNQPVLMVRDANDAPRCLVDPNTLSSDGAIAIDWFEPSSDGRFVAYGRSEGGTEESSLFVRSVELDVDLPDHIDRTRGASVAWLPDGSGFYYTRYPASGSVPDAERHYHRRVFFHALGQDASDDALVFGSDRVLTDYPTCALSPNGRWLLISVHQGFSKTELFLRDLSSAHTCFAKLTSGENHVYHALVHDDALYVLTNEGAPRYAVFTADPSCPSRKEWQPLVPEHESDVLSSIEVIGASLYAVYLSEGAARVDRYSSSGSFLARVDLPPAGSITGVSGLPDGDEALIDYQSFAVPPTVFRTRSETNDVEVWASAAAPPDLCKFVAERRSATSRDGTVIPYTVVRRSDMELARGPHPTLLYGYGGFSLSLTPSFSRTTLALLEQGVVYVQANLRGGGELGEAWHRAGMLTRKQNVFDDYYAVAEHLIGCGITEPAKLAISGRSNGGLLVAVALTQRPELFRAALVGVPLTDMVRYERFLVARLWVPEYGSVENREQFEALYAYSPYHHVKPGSRYPAVLITAAEGDTRVDPLHARKLAAALQEASESPVLLRIETDAGHGPGKSVALLAAEYTDAYSFVLSELGVMT
jgi:prolyl oligopeptidase